VGVPKAESDAIIRYLTELIATTQEAHVRFQWGVNDVAIWDNRVTTHTASFEFRPHRRHGTRVTTTAEKPYLDPAGKSQEKELNTKWGLPQVNKNGTLQSNFND
jgi:sulfonate dioxygenase